MLVARHLLLPVFTLALSFGCGSAEADRRALGFGEPAAAEPAPEAEGSSDVFGDDAYRAGGAPEDCAETRIVLREARRPIDVIVVLDNSVSMASELEAVERNINRSFAAVLERHAADYRVILLSRHRSAPRDQNERAETAVCVSAPLSSLASCPAPRPGMSARFFHYGVDIDSTNSLDRLLATFSEPDSLYRVTEHGWSEWLRPGARKVLLELSDDDTRWNAREFVRELTALAPEHFGASPDEPDFVFHSIVGVVERPTPGAYLPEEPIVRERCSNEHSAAPSAGYGYQTLSRMTGGLRYPLCGIDNYDVMFEAIARDSVQRAGLGCSFPVPQAPSGQRLDLSRVELVTSDGATPTGRAVASAEACNARGFYVHDGSIELCPELCAALLDGPATPLSAVFDCGAFVDVR